MSATARMTAMALAGATLGLAGCQASDSTDSPKPTSAESPSRQRTGVERLADRDRRAAERIRAQKFERFVLLAGAALPEFDLNAAEHSEDGVVLTVAPAWPSHSRGRKWDAIGMAWVLLDRVGYRPAVVTVLDLDGEVIEQLDSHPGAWPPKSWNP